MKTFEEFLSKHNSIDIRDGAYTPKYRRPTPPPPPKKRQQNKLKPCPFCGSKARVVKIPEGLNNSGLYVVGCDEDMICMGNINHFTMVFYTPETAAEIWNKRVNNE